MGKVSIPNIYIRFCTRKNHLSQGNYLSSLTKPAITRQRHFKPTDTEYDQFEDEIVSM